MIYDLLRLVSCPVEFIVIGSCEKEAIILLGAPKKVKRFATRNSILIVDQLSYNGAQFSALEDVKIIKNLLEKDNKKFIKILSGQLNKPEATIKSDLENKKYFTAQKAIEYGLIDHIASSKEVE
jgi:ATP-dependent Clp protease protease subunit